MKDQICSFCKSTISGGVITNGDPDGSASRMGMAVPKSALYCWDCYKNGKAPDFSKQIRAALAANNKCSFL